MKNNNKGFMLAEVVITSTVVLTSLISLYVTFNKLYKNYEIRSKYYDIDGYYATKETIEQLLNDGSINTILSLLTNKQYSKILEENENKTYITNYTKAALNSLKESEDINETFKDYLTYLTKYYNFTNDKYNYLFITEYKNGDDYYYANIGLG